MAAPYIIPLTHMAMTGSVYSVVAITVERFTTLKQINMVRVNENFNFIYQFFPASFQREISHPSDNLLQCCLQLCQVL